MATASPRTATPSPRWEPTEPTLGVIVTDERGLVCGFSSNIGEMGLDAGVERIGRHWSEMFPSFRRVPTTFHDDQEFIIVVESDRRAFRIRQHPAIGAEEMAGGTFLVVQPFEQPDENGSTPPLAVLSELAAGIAHEINNPLTTISGWMQIFLADSPPDDPTREQIESIQEELERIARIVDRLLAFAQKPGHERELLDVNDLLRNVVAFLQYQMRNADIRVKSSLSPALPAVEGNAGELKQVFLNLMVNARQAMGRGGSLHISTRQSADGAWVEIRFEDTGHGVPAELRERIFEPHVTTRANEGGSGLGLSVSREIIERHGGRLELEATSSAGSVFLVRLPAPREK